MKEALQDFSKQAFSVESDIEETDCQNEKFAIVHIDDAVGKRLKKVLENHNFRVGNDG